MQQGAPEASLYDLELAAELGSDNSDVFHHRGQVNSRFSSLIYTNSILIRDILQSRFFTQYS